MPSADIQPSHLGRTIPGNSWTVLAEAAPTDRVEPLCPALAVRTIGKGRVLFSSARWGAQYDERRDPTLAAWLRDVVIWLGGRPSAIRLAGSHLVALGAARADEAWVIYLINQSSNIQPSRLHGEMMKVCEPPLAAGPVDIRVEGASQAESLYGPEPDGIEAMDNGLRVRFDHFREHAVLHIR